MALFKVFRGQRNDLDSVTKVDGHAYFCTDDGSFWIDYLDGTTIKRKQVNESELASLNDKFDDYVLLNDTNINGNIVLADKKFDSDYELTLTPNFIHLLDSSTSSPSSFFLEADGGIVDLKLSTQNADNHNEYYTRLSCNGVTSGVTDEDGNDVAYASLLGYGSCLEVYSNEYGYAYFAPDGVSTDDGWMNLPQSSNDYHFDFSNNLRAASAISVFETSDFANEKWSTSYGWETITWHGVDGSGTPIANTFSLPSETNAGGTLATREWVTNVDKTIIGDTTLNGDILFDGGEIKLTNEVILSGSEIYYNGEYVGDFHPNAPYAYANKHWVESLVTNQVQYLGIVNSIDDIRDAFIPDNAVGKAGDFVRAGSSFTIETETVHPGDIIIANNVTPSISLANYDIVHTEDPGNYVTLATDQTISGYKKFNGGIGVPHEHGVGTMNYGYHGITQEMGAANSVSYLFPNESGTLATQEWVKQQIEWLVVN